MLRPFQLAALDAIDAAVASGLRRMRVTLAQGTGKPAVIGHALARMLGSGRASRALYLSPRRLLVEQMKAGLLTLDIDGGGPLGDSYQLLRLESATESTGIDRSVTVGTTAKFLALAREGAVPSFDLIVLEGLDGRVDWPKSVLAKTIERLDVTVIGFGSTPALDAATPGPTVFSYTFAEAAADRVLIDSSWLAATSREAAWPAFNLKDPVYRQRRLFIVGVEEDRSAVRALGKGLREAGIQNVMTHQAQLSSATAGDICILILSPRSMQTPLADERVSQRLERRGIEIIPAVIEYCVVPAFLASRLPVDTTQGITGLLRRLQANVEVDFSHLDARRFEELISELLARLGFTFATPDFAEPLDDRGFDLAAVFQDADGFGAATEYLIQVKRKRSSFREVDQLIHLVRQRGRSWRGMVVTDGHLTSVTENLLVSADTEGVAVQVVDGPRLRSLLLRFPDLTAKHFPAKAFQ